MFACILMLLYTRIKFITNLFSSNSLELDIQLAGIPLVTFDSIDECNVTVPLNALKVILHCKNRFVVSTHGLSFGLHATLTSQWNYDVLV